MCVALYIFKVSAIFAAAAEWTGGQAGGGAELPTDEFSENPLIC